MPPASAAWRIRCASALLTASGFSIMTWMRALCRRLDDRRMVAGVRERRDRLGLGRVEHRTEIREERRVGDLVALCIASQQRRVGLEDADYLHVRSPLRGAKEAAHVSVHEAGNRQPKRRPFLGSVHLGRAATTAATRAARNQARVMVDVFIGRSRRFFTSGQVYTAAPWRGQRS